MKQFIRFLIGSTLPILCLAFPLQGIGMPTVSEAPTDLFERYFWLDQKIDIANCGDTKVIEYLGDGNSIFYNYLYIIKDNKATLHNGFGFAICEDNNDGSCIATYDLTTMGSQWSCGEDACSIFEICPGEEAYYRLDRYFYRGILGTNCERDCDEVTNVTISPNDFATLDGLSGIRFNPPTTTTYTITYTVGKDGGAIGGDCNNTDVPCTVLTKTQQVCVIVKDCGRCDAPVAAADLLSIIDEGWLDAYNGAVIIEHFGPEIGYFYELKNKCPYNRTIDENINFNGYFYSCSGDLICYYGEKFWGLGNVPNCSSNPYQLDLRKATSSKVVYESDCIAQPTTYYICEGESVSLGYSPNGATPNDLGKPTAYDCSQPTVTIEQVGNPIQQENAFLVSPTNTTVYNIEVQHPNGTCPPRTYQYLVEVDTNCEETLTADNLPNRFPWLSNIVDFNNCSETTIEVYQQSVFNYLLITTPTTTTLYFQDGTFYCQNANNLDCKTAYQLVNPFITWNCPDSGFLPNLSNTQLREQTLINPFTINPNPSTGKFWLKLPISEGNHSTIKVYSALGKLVTIEKINPNNATTNLEIDLTNYEKGIYFIEYATSKSAITKKVIVK